MNDVAHVLLPNRTRSFHSLSVIARAPWRAMIEGIRCMIIASKNVFFQSCTQSNPSVLSKSSGIGLLRWSVVMMATISLVHAADSDFDGLDDTVETNTGVYVSASNTGTNPTKADTDGDGVPDGLEVGERTNPTSASEFNSFSVGLRACYTLNADTNDYSGNGFNLINNGATFGPGVADQPEAAAYFATGTSRPPSGNYGNSFGGQWMSFGNNHPLSGLSSLTVSLWLKPGTYLPQAFGNAAASKILYQENVVGFVQNGNAPRGFGFYTGNGSWFTGPPSIQDSQNGLQANGDWVHVIYTAGPAGQSVYCNKILASSTNTPITSVGSNSYTMGLGAHYNGSIDDLRIYNRVLTVQEIGSLYDFQRPKRLVTEVASGAGSINQEKSSTTILVTATPNPGYRFTSWTGDASGTQNPLTITMDADKTVGATFDKDLSDADNDGLTAYDEQVTYNTNPSVADSDGDGINDAQEITDKTNPLTADTDSDGLNDGNEISLGSDPLKADTDGDGVPDGLEVKEKTSPVNAMKFNSFSQGLAGYWSLDASFADTSGNQIDLVNTPSTQFLVGRNGRSNECLNFTSISGRAISSKPINISGNQNRTISYWCKIPQTDRTISVGWGTNQGVPSAPGTASCLVVDNNGSVFLWGAYSDITTQSNRLNPKIWNHVVVSYTDNFTSAKIAVNGKIQSHYTGSLNTLNQLNTSNTGVIISGYSFGDVSSSSSIDDIRIYNRALNEVEITNLYRSEAPQFQIIEGSYSWHQAKNDAEVRGGRLAILDTQNKQKIVESNAISLPQVRQYCIGLTDETNEGFWNWINGESVSYSKWAPGEPKAAQAAQDYAYFTTGGWGPIQFGQWNDETSNTTSAYGYILEKLYKIEILVPLGGEILGKGSYVMDMMTNLTATPNPGYRFSSWTGDAYGTQNPLSITMDADKTVGASFEKDLSDADNDGLTAYEELVTYNTNPNAADTDGDGINDIVEIQLGRSPKLAEAVITNLIAKQRTGTKFFDISYDLASTTPTVKMSLEISSDGGATYTVPVTSATGAIGEGISVGTGKSIVWNAGINWNAKLSSQMRFRLIADNQIIDGLSLIPTGSFTMGRTSGDTDSDAPPVNVTVSSFFMGKYEVTKALWDEVRTLAVANGYTDLAAGAGKAADHPVQTVSWWDVVKWCNARSQKEGLTPCYTVSGSVMKTGTTAPTVNWTANGYRLPTEAEWEKAARGGVSGKRFPWGMDTISHNEANFHNGGSETYKAGTSGYHPSFSTGSQPYTSPVGSFAPNGFGIYDMAGNVWEWCWDWYGSTSYSNNSSNPKGPANGTNKVGRGGSWQADGGAILCRTSYRGNSAPSSTFNNNGFRLTRSSGIGALTTINSTDTNLDTRMWTLTTSSLLNGNISGAGSYLSQTSANLTASPLSGYLFGSWSGDASGSENPITILMDSNKTVGATFVEDTRDPDNDGLTNYQEIIIRLTNPNLADSDNDGVNDGQEVTDTTNPLVADTDGDGLNDGEEQTRTTNPLVTDTDGDGLSDYQEIIIRLTNANLADTDNDGVNDGQEVTDATNPLVADSDGDGLNDGQEKTLGTNPLLTDTDDDGYSDSYEVNNNADPNAKTSFPTYTLTLANNGTVTGGTFAKSGTLAHGTNATLTATPLSGYLFGSWNGAASGSNNPTTVLMNSNKSVGATFVEDTRDPDNDGLTNYQEIIVRLTNPNVSDTDNDGVNDGQEVTDTTNPLIADTDADGLTDGEEKTRDTNPLLVDTDGDGLGDLQEITITQTNPIVADTNDNGVNDALEDSDKDGILNGREVYQLGTNPLLADTNSNGLSDTYELLFQGNTEPFTPRVGDRVRYDLSQLGYQGTYKLVGALPKGLTFNASTGILEGKLIGTASTSKLTIQILNGKTVLRSIPLNIPVLAFPATLAGTWQTLLENQQGQPEGLLTVTITSPGTWSASYDGRGTRTLRNAKGSFDLTAAEEEASWSMTFPATSALPSGLPAVTMSFDIVGSTALAEGTHPRGTLRGFRLARGTEVPTATKTITMLIDQGAQDGFLIPAGMGWATGSISNRGAVALKGQLGDAQAITASLSLGATGQALMWLKPYKNVNSYLGGIVSLHGSGVLPASPLHKQESGLLWYRAADSTEIAYPTGFAPMNATVGVRSHLTPASALSLSQNLGLTEQVIRGVVFDGAGLPDPNAAAKLPESFAIDAGYKMIAAPLPGQLMSPWTGLIASRSGGFTGTLGVAASNQGTLAGNAPVSGVLFPTVGSRVVGAGLVKIPIAGPKGSFRTAAIVLGTEQGNE